MKPVLSVIMPVYNADEFLREAVDSILSQTFKDFELIIIDDGSTDSSPWILDKYRQEDKRITLVHRENDGYVSALNQALDMARGTYTARMDADDAAQPTRFAKQVAYLESHPECAALFTRVRCVDESGKPIDDWQADKGAVSPKQIRHALMRENCVAHPSLMMRTDTMKSYRYDVSQTPSEDYDLWLRLLADGKSLHKLKEKLLSYRVHAASVSQTSIRQSSTRHKYFRVKSAFLRKRLGQHQFGWVEFRIGLSASWLFIILAWGKARHYVKNTRDKSINSVKAASKTVNKLYRRAFPPRKNILFVLPWMTVGGADKVFLDIVSGLNKRRCSISCITTTPSSNEWRGLFEPHCKEIIDLSQKVSAEDMPSSIADYVSGRNIDTVVTSNNIAGYSASVWIKRQTPAVRIFDIVHGQGGKKEAGGTPLHSSHFDHLLDRRIVVTDYMKDYLVRKFSVDPRKIEVIHNGVCVPGGDLPAPVKEMVKKTGQHFTVLWSGRLAGEKHPELAIEIARLVARKDPGIHFVIAGDGPMKKSLKSLVKKYGLEKTVMLSGKFYEDYRGFVGYADVLLMTSEMEGLPIVTLEAFSLGVPVVATKVGGIPEVVKSGESGYLASYGKDFTKKAAEKIAYLANHPEVARQMGAEGKRDVETNFTVDAMVRRYEDVFGIGYLSLAGRAKNLLRRYLS